MSDLPKKAKVVIIGAGIVGNCLTYHLARLGWQDIVLLDKGPLPNPGGSTGHASNFIFPVDHAKEMALLTAGQHEAVQRVRRFHRERRHRSSAHRSANGRTPPPYGLGQIVADRIPSAHPCRN